MRQLIVFALLTFSVCQIKCETLGTLEITIATASLQKSANAYADICIQNDTTTAVTLPFKNRTLCKCQTKTIVNSSIPVWQLVCTLASYEKYVSTSRIVFEVYDQTSSTSTTFLGGATVDLSQTIANNDIGKQLTLPFAGGVQTGNIYAKINYTITSSNTTINTTVNAKDRCITIHHTDVDSASYSNAGCNLTCNIHNVLWPHNISEGEVCPEYVGTARNNMICKYGQCITPIRLGYIDVEVISAELMNKSNGFVDVCLQNDSSAVVMPIRERTGCTCETPVVDNTAQPKWQYVCKGSSSKIWSDNARITFEIFDKITSSVTNFVGGASLTIQQLIANGDSHKAIPLAIGGGTQSGVVTIRVTWTQA